MEEHSLFNYQSHIEYIETMVESRMHFGMQNKMSLIASKNILKHRSDWFSELLAGKYFVY